MQRLPLLDNTSRLRQVDRVGRRAIFIDPKQRRHPRPFYIAGIFTGILAPLAKVKALIRRRDSVARKRYLQRRARRITRLHR